MDFKIEEEKYRYLLTAPQVARRLGIRLSSVYAYVSRGRIRAVHKPGDPRRSFYLADDVEELIRQKAMSRSPGAASASALDFGLPILTTEISEICGGRLFYRGQDATIFANSHSFEETAHLLWDCAKNPFLDLGAATEWALVSLRVAEVLENATPVARAMALLATLATPAVSDRRTPDFVMAAGLLLNVARAILGKPLSPGKPLHVAIASSYGREDAEDAIRRALVLSAEHELNTGTFAVRVAASSGADLAAAMCAGFASFSCFWHNGMYSDHDVFCDLGIQMISEGSSHNRRPNVPLAGFGHRLYPDGDPRALALLRHVEIPTCYRRIHDWGAKMAGARPNVAAALSVMARSLGLPAGAAFAVFAVGRLAGWIAHYFEQIASGHAIRPRSAYRQTAARS